MTFNKELLSKFPALLLHWNSHGNIRKMPWKGEKDPYKIWLSEIILQQTRVDQGWRYYEKFVTVFPDINKLAAAKDEKIYKPVSYTHLRAHETPEHLVCRLLLEKK